MPESGFFRSIFGRSRTFHHKSKGVATLPPQPKQQKKEEEEEKEEEDEFTDATTFALPPPKQHLPRWKEGPTTPTFADADADSSFFSPTSLRRSSTTTTFHRHTFSTPTGARVLTPRWGKKVVLYTTSLRSIRRTYEDCRAVKAILRGLRVAVDERDLAMDAAYRREMQVLLGGRQLALPRAFVGRKCLGGVEEIRQLHEDGELEKLLDNEGVAREAPGFFCRACGGLKFLPCDVCDGSRKVFDEEEDQLKRCLDCNENGLVRCTNCS